MQGRVGRRVGRLAMELVPAADTSQRHQRGDGLARVGLVQGLLLPLRRVLPLQRDPGGVADRPVLVAEEGPGGLDGARVRVPVVALQLPAQVPLPGPGWSGLAGSASSTSPPA